MRESANITPSFGGAKIAREPKLPCDAWRPGGLAKGGAAGNSPRSILHVVLRPRSSGVETLAKALGPLHLDQECRDKVRLKVADGLHQENYAPPCAQASRAHAHKQRRGPRALP